MNKTYETFVHIFISISTYLHTYMYIHFCVHNTHIWWYSFTECILTFIHIFPYLIIYRPSRLYIFNVSVCVYVMFVQEKKDNGFLFKRTVRYINYNIMYDERFCIWWWYFIHSYHKTLGLKGIKYYILCIFVWRMLAFDDNRILIRNLKKRKLFFSKLMRYQTNDSLHWWT